MISEFDKFIQSIFLEAAPPEENQEGAQEMPQDAPAEGEVPPEGEDLSGELAEEEPVFPEEMELAKLAIRALHFNRNSKDVHNLKMKVAGREIPFEKISDYFEETKQVIPILGFVEWVMDRYEGAASAWIHNNKSNITSTIKKINSKVPEEQRLDNNNRLDWTRIILNSLLRGSSNFNVNIADVNEKTIKEIRNTLSQSYANDSRGLFSGGSSDFIGPATF